MQSATAYWALVQRLESQSQERPGFYKFKLALLAFFGFAILGGSALLAFVGGRYFLGLLAPIGKKPSQR